MNCESPYFNPALLPGGVIGYSLIVPDAPIDDNVVFVTIRDIRSYHRLSASSTLKADLRGLVTSQIKTRSLTFLVLNDGTDAIQIILGSNLAHDNAGIDICPLDFDRVRIIGEARDFINRRTGEHVFSIFATAPPELLARLPIPADPAGLDVDLIDTGVHVLLARLKDRTREIFTTAGFIEVEPRYISLNWEDSEIKPLRVNYQGFGAPFYLVPSPKAQLFRVIATTGWPKVFAASRCFTPSYRDGISGGESAIVMGCHLGGDIERISQFAETLLRTIFGHFQTMPEDISFLNIPCTRVDLFDFPEPNAPAVSVPTLQIISRGFTPADPSKDIQLFRLLWPVDPTHALALVDGACEFLSSNVTLAYCSIHLERLIVLLQRRVSLRRVRNLEPR